MLKKVLTLNFLVVISLLFFTTSYTKKDNSSLGNTAKSDNQQGFTIKFYHTDEQYNRDMITAFQSKNPNIKVQLVPMDVQNVEKDMKLRIAAKESVDVSFFWGNMINSFSDYNMAEDLTPYLEANNNEWKNTFLPDYIDVGRVGGKYYAVPYEPELQTIFYNKDLFKKLNIQVPDTLDEFMSVCDKLKSNGFYGIGVRSNQQDQLLTFAYQFMANAGNIDEVTSGKIPFAGPDEVPGFRQALEKIRDIYQKGYWYPGQKALIVSDDEVVNAFCQGKIGMLFDSGSQIKSYTMKSDFELGVMKYPRIRDNSKYAVNIITNALFVPHIALHKKEAVDFIKFYTSEEGQRITMNSWKPPVLKNLQMCIPQVQEILDTAETGNSVRYMQLQRLSPEIQSYLSKEIIPSVCLGGQVDTALETLENLRKKLNKK